MHLGPQKKKPCITEHLSFYTVEHVVFNTLQYLDYYYFLIITVELYTWCHDEGSSEAVSPVQSL